MLEHRVEVQNVITVFEPAVFEKWRIAWDRAQDHIALMKLAQRDRFLIHGSDRHHAARAQFVTRRKKNYQPIGLGRKLPRQEPARYVVLDRVSNATESAAAIQCGTGKH